MWKNCAGLLGVAFYSPSDLDKTCSGWLDVGLRTRREHAYSLLHFPPNCHQACPWSLCPGMVSAPHIIHFKRQIVFSVCGPTIKHTVKEKRKANEMGDWSSSKRDGRRNKFVGRQRNHFVLSFMFMILFIFRRMFDSILSPRQIMLQLLTIQVD